jgi:hydroxymethylglutaryl-CoA synthase
MASSVARKVGGAHASKAVYDAAGDTGAAAALLGAVAALGSPGLVGIVGYGGGRTVGVSLDVTAAVPGAGALAGLLAAGRAATYAEVLRSRGQLVPTGESVPMGIPPASAGFVRGAREMLQLLGAKCVECGLVNMPPSIHPHCVGCGAEKFTEVSLARRGTVQTFVVNHTMPAPFVAPLPLAVIDLEDGARVMLQVTDAAAAAPLLAIDDEVELVLRRYADERGAPVYGFKARRTGGEA